jgi:hypothetical protein
MKNTIIALLCLTAALSAFANETLSGNWELNQDIEGNTATVAFELNQEGDRLSGAILLSDTKRAPISGKVSGSKITFQYPTEWEGQALTMVYSGNLGADGGLSGSVEVKPLGVTGDFRAKRVEKK